MVAISQRSIPKDQLYEKNNDKKYQDTLFCTNTTKISSFFYFDSMYYKQHFAP